MQQLIVNIPDNKIAFFMDLAKNLGFTIEKTISTGVTPQKESKGKASSLRGRLSPMTNEQIDQQFNDMRNEWQKDI
jgi:hypothetical protein